MPTLPILQAIASYMQSAGIVLLTVEGATSYDQVNGPWIYNTDALHGCDEGPVLINGQSSYTHYCGDYLLSWDSTQWTLTDGAATPTTLYTSPTLTGTYTNAAGSGTLTVTDTVVNWGERQGNVAQMMISAFGMLRHHERDMYKLYGLQCDCFHSNRQAAEMWSLAVKNYFNQFEGTSSAAPGISMNGYYAQQVHVEHKGVLEIVGAVDESKLYRALTIVYFTNLERM